MSDRRDSLDRRLAFRREIAEALNLGANRSDVAEVVRAFVGDPEVDPGELRRELQKLVPHSERFRDDEATGDLLPVADKRSLLPARPAARRPSGGAGGAFVVPGRALDTEQPRAGTRGC